VICEGDLEKSQLLQEEMSAAAQEFYQSLGFPYRVISIVTGESSLAFSLSCLS
jgi:seryl-tRNA synthetase